MLWRRQKRRFGGDAEKGAEIAGEHQNAQYGIVSKGTEHNSLTAISIEH
jgi:hypothetical protein